MPAGGSRGGRPTPPASHRLLRWRLIQLARGQLASRGEAKLIIYNALGQEVRRLISATQDAGTYQVRWDGKDNLGRELSSGVYVYRLLTRDMVFTRKMIYVR